jgi:hypothetical protein
VHTNNKDTIRPVTWWQCEPRRLARDRREVTDWFRGLEWHADGAGRWAGCLPRWPFTRPEPPGLARLVGVHGVRIEMLYGHAYPMAPPSIYPVDPIPEIIERTDHRWHVSGDGSLCLLQNDAAWTGRGSIVELLLKAAGWRVEYGLMKAGVIDAMTVHGIIDDDQLDHLVQVAIDVGDDVGPPRQGGTVA